MMLPTHVVVGLTISSLFFLPLSWMIVGSIIPDLDYLFGLQHRTITHSLLFTASGLIVYKFWGKHAGLSYTLGLMSHVVFDLITPMGAQLLYPLQIFYSFNLVSASNYLANTSIMLVCLVFIINRKSIQEALINMRKGVLLKGTAALFSAFFISSLFFPVSNCTFTSSINSLINGEVAGESEVIVENGTICSDIDSYTSKAGNNYQIFRLCQGNDSILVWKGDWVLENNLSNGDVISLCSVYTEQYDEPELYYIKWVSK